MIYVAFAGGGGGGPPLLGRVIYEAENTTPAGLVAGAPVTKKADFMARLTVTGAEDWESKTVADPIHGQTSTINGVNVAYSIIDGDPADSNTVRGSNAAGRFNTTPSGANYISAFTNFPTEPRTKLLMAFGTSVAAFGAYFTDIGDFAGGQMTMTLTKSAASGGGTVAIDINHTVGAPNGALYFWGFVDDTDTYASVELKGIGDSASDGYGVDDIVVATAAQLA